MKQDLRPAIQTRSGMKSLGVPPKSILSFVDFSPASLRGAKLAAELSIRWGTALELVHVAESIPPALSENADSLSDCARRERYFRSVASRLKDVVQCRRMAQAVVVEGDPEAVLRGLASERAEDLIVIGTRSHGDLKQRLFGSTLRAIVEASRVPVLTVREPIRSGWPGRVLVLVGQEAHHDRALLYGMALAHKLDAAVSLAHIVEGPEAKRAAEQTLQSRLRRLGVEGDRRLNERISCADVSGSCLAERAQAGDIGLLLLATRRDRPWDPAVLGPAAEAAIDGCDVPILTVPADATGFAELLAGLSSDRRPGRRAWGNEPAH